MASGYSCIVYGRIVIHADSGHVNKMLILIYLDTFLIEHEVFLAPQHNSGMNKFMSPSLLECYFMLTDEYLTEIWCSVVLLKHW